MTKFPDNDLDRSWSSSEIEELSDRELTILAFQRDCKNILFFIPQAVILYFIARYFGWFGQIVGWIGIILFGIFALQNAINFLVGIFALATNHLTKGTSEKSSFGWKAIAVFMSLAETMIYFLAGLIICAGIYKWF
jgi:hypothetical protein